MPTTWSKERATWSDRIERAVELSNRNPWAAEVLNFYAKILEFQQEVYETSQALGAPAESELRDAINLDQAARWFPELAGVVQSHGPAKLAEAASWLQKVPLSEVRAQLKLFLADDDAPQDSASFFVRVLLQPQAEWWAQARGAPEPGVVGNRCPACASKPQLAVIRPEGDGGKRMLLCSLCQSEWQFRRILCPVCGEENHEKLPRYTAEGIPAVRVEGCDTCKRYLKSVDLTADGLAIPVVDEVATAPLDLWAVEHDYRKIQLNLMGF